MTRREGEGESERERERESERALLLVSQGMCMKIEQVQATETYNLPAANLGGKPNSCESCVRMGEKKSSAVLPKTRKSSTRKATTATCPTKPELVRLIEGVRSPRKEVAYTTPK